MKKFLNSLCVIFSIISLFTVTTVQIYADAAYQEELQNMEQNDQQVSNQAEVDTEAKVKKAEQQKKIEEEEKKNSLGETKTQERQNNEKHNQKKAGKIENYGVVKTIITILTVIIVGFIATLVAVACQPSAIRVPSAIIFIATGIAYLATELSFYIAYKARLKDLERAKKELKIKEGQDYNEQYRSLEQLYNVLMETYKIEISKAALLTAIEVAYSSAEAAALAETVALLAIEKSYQAAKKVFDAYSESYITQEVDIAANEEYLYGIQEPYADQLVSAEGIVSTEIQDAPMGKPISEESGEIGSNAELEGKVDTIATHNTDLQKDSTTFSSASSEAYVEIELAIDAAATGVGAVATAVAVEALAVLEVVTGYEKLLSGAGTVLTGLAKVLKYTRLFTVLTCKSLTKTDPQTSTFFDVFGLFKIPSAYANALNTLLDILVPLGITAGPVVALALRLKKVKLVTADSVLYHPITRAAFLAVVIALVGTATGLTYAAAYEAKDRAEKVKKMMDRVEKLKGAHGRGEKDEENEVAGFDRNEVLQTQTAVESGKLAEERPSEASSEFPDTCVGQDMKESDNCACRKTNSCYQNKSSANIEYDFGGYGSTQDFQQTNIDINNMTNSLTHGQTKQALVHAGNISQRKAFLQATKASLVNEIRSTPRGDMLYGESQRFKKDLLNGLLGQGQGAALLKGFKPSQFPQIAGIIKPKGSGSDSDSLKGKKAAEGSTGENASDIGDDFSMEDFEISVDIGDIKDPFSDEEIDKDAAKELSPTEDPLAKLDVKKFDQKDMESINRNKSNPIFKIISRSYIKWGLKNNIFEVSQ